MANERRERPGLAKVRTTRLVRERRVHLLAGADGRWREVFEAADAVSEGCPREEPEGLVYYGTTSLLLSVELDADVGPRELAAFLASDPHLRLRALRIARREAMSRVDQPLGTVRAEVTIELTARGLEVSVDVAARVLRGRKAGAGG